MLARLRLRRREVLWWATALALAVVTVAVLSGALGEAGTGADRWGPARPVRLASEPIEIGQTVEAGDVTVADWPAALVPPDPVIGDAEGRVAVAAIGAGEVLVESRLAPDGLRGPVALLPPDTRALAVPDVPGGLALRPGDVVDVLAVVDPFSLAAGADVVDGGPAQVVAAGATVVAVTDDSTTVAVPIGRVPEVAAALGQGVVTLALASPVDPAGG